MTEIPDELIKAAAEARLRTYESQYQADHLTWRDFTGEASEVLAAVLPAHEAMVRARVAAETEMDEARLEAASLAALAKHGAEIAAEIARGGTR